MCCDNIMGVDSHGLTILTRVVKLDVNLGGH